jgi:hypothetical protein
MIGSQRQKPCRVQHEGQFGRDVNERGEEATEKAEGGQSDSERIDDERAAAVLPNDVPGPASDDVEVRRVSLVLRSYVPRFGLVRGPRARLRLIFGTRRV